MKKLLSILLIVLFSVVSAQTASLKPSSPETVITLSTTETSATYPINVVPDLDSIYVGLAFEEGVEIVLADPNGNSFAPSDSSSTSATFLVPTPTAGNWTLQVSHDQSTKRTAYVEVFNNGAAAPRVGVIVRYDNIQGAGVTLSAALFQGDRPIKGAEVDIKVARGDGFVAATATALDNGNTANADAKVADGLYSTVIEGLKPNFYIANVTATLPSGAVLGGSEFFEVFAGTGTLTGSVKDAGIDVEGDGFINRIDFTLGVDIQRSGGYAAEVLLRASNGNEAWTSNGYDELTTASTTITTSIPADEIKEKLGVDGPYELKSVRLFWSPGEPSTTPEHIASEFLDYGSTNAYRLSELDRVYLLFTRYLGDEGIDLNGNGQFDLIRASFEVDSAINGSYTFAYNARLVPEAGLPADGRESFASNEQTLSPGLNTITLDFPVEEYGVNGVGGPYLVTGASLYPVRRLPSPYDRVSGEKFQNLPSVLGTTDAYSSFELEGGLPGDIPSLIAFVKTIEIDSPGNSANALKRQLINPLEKAQAELDKGRVSKVRNQLNTFLNKVDAQSGKKIQAADAEVMRQAVAFISANLD